MFEQESLFSFEWQPASEEVRSRELASTWARIELHVDGNCLTVVEDIPTGSIRRSIYVSLFPLAEWIVFNGWDLLFGPGKESLRSTVTASNGAAKGGDGSNLRSAGDGFLWPDVAVAAMGGGSLLTWCSDSLRGLDSRRSHQAPDGG